MKEFAKVVYDSRYISYSGVLFSMSAFFWVAYINNEAELKTPVIASIIFVINFLLLRMARKQLQHDKNPYKEKYENLEKLVIKCIKKSKQVYECDQMGHEAIEYFDALYDVEKNKMESK